MGCGPGQGDSGFGGTINETSGHVGLLLNATLPSAHLVDGGFGAGLFPFHSQLLGESLLFSFPPLNDMLKFGG